jgi:hypothetical protein
MVMGVPPASTTTNKDQMISNQDMRTDKQDTKDKKMESIIPNAHQQTDTQKKSEYQTNITTKNYAFNYLL